MISAMRENFAELEQWMSWAQKWRLRRPTPFPLSEWFQIHMTPVPTTGRIRFGVAAIGRRLSGVDPIDLLDKRAEPTAFGGMQGVREHRLRSAGLVRASLPIELRPSEL
jgi:hypothetical protein